MSTNIESLLYICVNVKPNHLDINIMKLIDKFCIDDLSTDPYWQSVFKKFVKKLESDNRTNDDFKKVCDEEHLHIIKILNKLKIIKVHTSCEMNLMNYCLTCQNNSTVGEYIIRKIIQYVTDHTNEEERQKACGVLIRLINKKRINIFNKFYQSKLSPLNLLENISDELTRDWLVFTLLTIPSQHRVYLEKSTFFKKNYKLPQERIVVLEEKHPRLYQLAQCIHKIDNLCTMIPENERHILDKMDPMRSCMPGLQNCNITYGEYIIRKITDFLKNSGNNLKNCNKVCDALMVLINTRRINIFENFYQSSLSPLDILVTEIPDQYTRDWLVFTLLTIPSQDRDYSKKRMFLTKNYKSLPGGSVAQEEYHPRLYQLAQGIHKIENLCTIIPKNEQPILNKIDLMKSCMPCIHNCNKTYGEYVIRKITRFLKKSDHNIENCNKVCDALMVLIKTRKINIFENFYKSLLSPLDILTEISNQHTQDWLLSTLLMMPVIKSYKCNKIKRKVLGILKQISSRSILREKNPDLFCRIQLTLIGSLKIPGEGNHEQRAEHLLSEVDSWISCKRLKKH